MRHQIELLSGRVIVLRPVEGAPAVLVPGLNCLGCGKPLAVCGGAMTTTPSADRRTRTHEAKALEACCGHHIGTLRSWTEEGDTLFGADEDEAVLNGRARVYGGGARRSA